MKKTDEEIVEIFRNTLSFAEQLGLSNSPNKANLLLLVKQSYRLAEAFMQSENELLQKENEELNRKLADREREILLLKDEKFSDDEDMKKILSEGYDIGMAQQHHFETVKERTDWENIVLDKHKQSKGIV